MITKDENKLLSIVLPSYNEEKSILKTAEILSQILKENQINYELVFVNDGSEDQTWNIIKEAHKFDSQIVGVCFSRNFGKEAAIYAGLKHTLGTVVAVMDCDLQHPPNTLLEMYHLWEQGYEVIEGVKTDRGKESFVHKIASKVFYKIMSKSIGIDMENASDFKMLDRKAVNSLCSMPERNTFFRALSSWVGYKKATVYFEVQERLQGKSKWSIHSLIRYALDNISAFTAAPLQLVTISGVFTFFIGVIMSIQTLMQYFKGNAVEGFTTVILLLLYVGSIIMISLGILGYYLSKIYDEIKHRPKYIVSDKT